SYLQSPKRFPATGCFRSMLYDTRQRWPCWIGRTTSKGRLNSLFTNGIPVCATLPFGETRGHCRTNKLKIPSRPLVWKLGSPNRILTLHRLVDLCGTNPASFAWVESLEIVHRP